MGSDMRLSLTSATLYFAPFFVKLSHPSSVDVRVRYHTEPGTAQNSVPARVGADHERFPFTLSDPINAPLRDGQATFTINNNRVPSPSIAD